MEGRTTRIDRITRVKMLLSSYQDARPGLLSRSGDRVSTSRGSSIPQMSELWARGSYAELEAALEELSLVSRQRLFRAWIWQPDRRRRNVQFIYRRSAARELQRDLQTLSDLMPRRIFIPTEVRQNWQDYIAEPKGDARRPQTGRSSYTLGNNSRSAPAAPVQTGNQERERLGGND